MLAQVQTNQTQVRKSQCETLPCELRAVLTIFEADKELRRKTLPYVDLVRQEIDWDGIFANDFGGGHSAVLGWAKAIWCCQVSTKSDPFDRIFSAPPHMQAAVLKALAIRWGLSYETTNV